jgi:hypothetical protein
MSDDDAEAAKKAEAARQASERTKKLYEDPEFRKKQSQGAANTWKDPEYRAKISKARKEQHAKGKGGRGGGAKKGK